MKTALNMPNKWFKSFASPTWDRLKPVLKQTLGKTQLRQLLLIALIAVPLSAISAEKRCGWLDNPSPANLWLIDADSDWTISTQGGKFASDETIDNMPEIDDKEFVRRNGHYGFSCVCLNVKTDKEKSEILEVYSGQQLFLKQCLEDPKLYKKVP